MAISMRLHENIMECAVCCLLSAVCIDINVTLRSMHYLNKINILYCTALLHSRKAYLDTVAFDVLFVQTDSGKQCSCNPIWMLAASEWTQIIRRNVQFYFLRKRLYQRQFISVHLAVCKSQNTLKIAMVMVMLPRYMMLVSLNAILSFVIWALYKSYHIFWMRFIMHIVRISYRPLWWAFMPLSTQHEMLILTGFNNVC